MNPTIGHLLSGTAQNRALQVWTVILSPSFFPFISLFLFCLFFPADGKLMHDVKPQSEFSSM